MTIFSAGGTENTAGRSINNGKFSQFKRHWIH